MPHKDTIHDAVKNALIKDGWTITDDPFRIIYEDADVFADLRIEKTTEQLPRRALVIEIKSFSGLSPIHELGNALGQYDLYRTYLDEVEPTTDLYLAVSETIYDEQFTRRSFAVLIEKKKLALLVVDVNQEEVRRWIK